ncbi:C-type lectin domain family 10 member A-like isoform X2 [Mixophyes fleayi]
MGVDQDDIQLYIKEDSGGDNRISQWYRQPMSSRLLGLLIGLCAGLIVLNIIITVTNRDFREKEIERLLASQLCVPEAERQSQNTGDVLQKLPGQSVGTGAFQPDNGTYEGACPGDWHQFKESCYYVSNLAKSWQESHKMCQWRDAKLAVINTMEEQVYLTKLANRIRVWIGLSEVDGDWKWVDGTPYSTTPKKWASGQPDEYFGHGLGGGEDCAQLYYNGDWNDEHCSRAYRFICERNAK